MLRHLAMTLLLFLLLSPAARAAPATLVADNVSVDGNSRLVAEGHVEVLYETYRLKASRIIYDADTDRLTIDGPMTVTTLDGRILQADQAMLAGDLSEGLLTSARLVLDQQLQLAAAEIRRVGGRYSVLDKTVASSCTVCASNPVPLWQIRARRVIHDEEKQQLYFDHARLELVGVPIFYLPRLRMPDPTLERSNGFLVPSIRATNGLGTGLKLPYFVTLGRHADVTITPYFSTNRTRTLELRYRQAFRNGEIELNGALSRDDLLPDDTRRYLFADGRFDLPRDFTLSFEIKTVSDRAYLLDYGISETDRLISPITISRTRRDEFIRAELTYVHSLRASENNATLPSTLAGATWQHRFSPATLGGIAETELEVFGYNRRSGSDIAGRDVARASGAVSWKRDWRGASGLLLEAKTALVLDYYAIEDDSTRPDPIFRAAPFTAAALRWPLVKHGASGAVHVLEPAAQLVWSRNDSSDIPNEDSLSTEFDEGNLFSLNRYPGSDAYEQGLRANIGIGWTRFDPRGWSLSLGAGRILRAENNNSFSSGSGLNGVNSDWLATANLTTARNLRLTNRALFDDELRFERNELQVGWNTEMLELSSSYVWLRANPAESRPVNSSEWEFNTSYRFRRNWTGEADWRYDFTSERAARAGLGLEYRNECMTVGLSVSRRFTSTTSLRPTTDFGLTVSLAGFGSSNDSRGYRQTCTR
jgi:LPS-assembly protein